MFGLGTWEIIIILVVALVFIGPDKLPQVAKSIGKGMRQVRTAMDQMDTEVRRAANDYVSQITDDEDEAPPTGPAPTAQAAPEASAPPSPSPSPSAATANAAPAPPAERDWHAHAAQPLEGRVAAAPPGRRVARGPEPAAPEPPAAAPAREEPPT